MIISKIKLHERLRALYEKYEDPESARCVIQAIDIEGELSRTRFDRIKDWSLLALIGAYLLHGIFVWGRGWP